MATAPVLDRPVPKTVLATAPAPLPPAPTESQFAAWLETYTVEPVECGPCGYDVTERASLAIADGTYRYSCPNCACVSSAS